MAEHVDGDGHIRGQDGLRRAVADSSCAAHEEHCYRHDGGHDDRVVTGTGGEALDGLTRGCHGPCQRGPDVYREHFKLKERPFTQAPGERFFTPNSGVSDAP